jgi:hypothetical protein
VLTLLWSADDLALRTSGVLSSAVKIEVETQLVKHFEVLDQLRGESTPRPVVKFRLVPTDVTFEHLTKTKVAGTQRPPLDLIAVVPRPLMAPDVWARNLVGTALHEYVHMLQWDATHHRFDDLYEAEAQAYAIQICAAYLAHNMVPAMVYEFPTELTEAVGDWKDIPIAELFVQGREMKEAATIIGLSSARLAFHRFFTELRAATTAAPSIDQAIPLCKAIARGDFVWTDSAIDARVSEFAKAAAKPDGDHAGQS